MGISDGPSGQAGGKAGEEACPPCAGEGKGFSCAGVDAMHPGQSHLAVAVVGFQIGADIVRHTVFQ